MKTHQLPIGAKVEVTLQDHSGKKIPTIVTFGGMDGMYGKFMDEEHNIYPFNAEFKLVKGDFYEVV